MATDYCSIECRVCMFQAGRKPLLEYGTARLTDGQKTSVTGGQWQIESRSERASESTVTATVGGLILINTA